MAHATIGLIWAQAASRVIGSDGGIPWSLPEDQRRFRDLTRGHSVLMGRRTWESLPASVRPLPGRRNLVLSRDPARVEGDGAEVVRSMDEALGLVGAAGDGAPDAELWVIGGAAVYAAALPHASRVEVTEVDVEVPGDTYAPALDGGWRAEHHGGWQVSRGGVRYRFVTYRRA